MVGKALNERFLDMIRLGFWMRTKQPPYRAVKWSVALHPDGRQTFRGRRWVEVLAHGEEGREPSTFFGEEVTPAEPTQWLDYYPAVDEPVCGWGRPRLPDGEMQFCPQPRTEGQAFCPRHITELNGSEGEENHGGEDDSHSE